MQLKFLDLKILGGSINFEMKTSTYMFAKSEHISNFQKDLLKV